jgi:hypothetical protein
MTANVNHVIQLILTLLQGVNIAAVPANAQKYVVVAISALQWYVSNIVAWNNPVTGAKLPQ